MHTAIITYLTQESSPALGRQHPDVTKQPLLSDCSTTPNRCGINHHFAQNRGESLMQGGAVDVQFRGMKLHSGPTNGATKAVLSNEAKRTAASPTTSSSIHRSSPTTGPSAYMRWTNTVDTCYDSRGATQKWTCHLRLSDRRCQRNEQKCKFRQKHKFDAMLMDSGYWNSGGKWWHELWKRHLA